ncbi:MAG: SusD/RagB family nutrient-binding outer membrane lipoprotein [Puia sp.]|nr:SusD/RagB family nutrient-binding outer membrane lipoprotein [Puia sp.]
MRNARNIYIYLLFGVAVIAGQSCTKGFQQANANQQYPSTTTVPPLVNQAISSLFLGWTEQASIHNDYYYPVTQLAAISSVSGYLQSNGVGDIWNGYYSNLQNINLALDMANAVSDQETMNNIKAILLILRAYKTFHVTDQFGDIPYFNAGKAYTGAVSDFRVAYDPQQLIYDSLFSDLKWAAANIRTDAAPMSAQGNPYVTLGGYDTFFKGNMASWLAFANSLLLRQSMQIVEKDAATATPIIADLLNNSKPLIGEGQDVGMWPANLGGYDLSGRWWSFSSGGAGFTRLSSTLWNLVSDGTNTADIFDPRARLFVDTNSLGKWAPYTIGSNASDYVDAYADPVDPSKDNGALFSRFNWYLVRDEWYIPELIFTAAEIHFLKAEAYARGLGVSQDLTVAETEYQSGITSSVNFWYSMVAGATNVGGGHLRWDGAAPAAPTPVQMTALLTNPKVKFAGGQSDALQKIYAQEWLSYYREPWLAFNLWRRTGATPVDPASTPPTSNTTFYRLPYPQDEAVNNTDNFNAQVAKMGTNNTNVKVWWMP